MHRSSGIVAAAVMSAAVLLDQLTKVWIRSTFTVGESVQLFGPVYLTHVENRGAVFGIGQGYVAVPTIATAIILVSLPVVIRHLRVRYGYSLTRLEAVCVGLIAGGAIGNLIDRLSRAAVTDFVDVELYPGFHWPAFNVADACVVVATLLLLAVFLHHGSQESKHNANP
ncbi:MAG: signal peptidase II [Dehalococcoidia bacterium]|nr:signal peptidase II [Dehalococcoidia bacterium]